MIKPTKAELLRALEYTNANMKSAEKANNERWLAAEHAAFYAIARELWDEAEKKETSGKENYIHKIEFTTGDVRYNVDIAHDAPPLDGFIAVKTFVDVADPDKPTVDLTPAVQYININTIESMIVKEREIKAENHGEP